MRDIELEIGGLGIIIYSPSAAAHIRDGEDYLAAEYMNGEQVQRHVQAGTIVAFATSSPGTFRLCIGRGYPTNDALASSDFKLRLGIKVTDACVCFRDLYDLMEWTSACPPEQVYPLENGFHHITLMSNLPPSRILGDNQTIYVYFNPLPAMPALAKLGLPTLCV